MAIQEKKNRYEMW